MLQRIFPFLKRNLPQDPFLINRIFVSIYLIYNKVEAYNQLIERYVISETDKDYEELGKVLSFLDKQNVKMIDMEDMIKLFEFVISPSDRIVTGAIYTPKKIRKYILDACLRKGTDLSHVRIADIACGCGGFLMDAARMIYEATKMSYREIFKRCIYGIDIQNYSIERCQILLNLLALTEGEVVDFEFNLLCADTLDFKSDEWNSNFDHFDVIVGNPPYVCGRNMEDDTRLKTKWYEVCDSGSTDLYIPFFQIAVEMLNDEGKIGYITMNSFLKSLNARKLRAFFADNQFDIHIVDFRGHQVFKGKSTYTCLFFLEKDKSKALRYCCDEQGKLARRMHYEDISWNLLDAGKGWNLNQNKVANKIESVGIPLFEFCQTRHGIATLSNKTYIFLPNKEDGKYYYLDKEGVCYPIEKVICKDIMNSNKLNSEKGLDGLVHKVIFPYVVDENGKVVLIKEENMQAKYPSAYSYLLSQREILDKRDKGKTRDYPVWYAYGRTQSLVMPAIKMFFPKIANKPLNCIIVEDSNLLLYNGMAFVGDDMRKMKILQKILESDIFWNYVVANSKPYTSGYYSLNGSNIKNFGVPEFTIKEEEELLCLADKDAINQWLSSFYE